MKYFHKMKYVKRCGNFIHHHCYRVSIYYLRYVQENFNLPFNILNIIMRKRIEKVTNPYFQAK